jgi:hypothetical protein
MESETSHGQRPLASKCWSTLLPLSLSLAAVSSSMATTPVSLKDGGEEVAKTKQSIEYSDASMNSCMIYPDISRSTQYVSLASPTQPTVLPEAYTAQKAFYSLPLIFLLKQETSSSMHYLSSPTQSSAFSVAGSTPLQQPKSSTEHSSDNRSWKELEHLVPRKNGSYLMLLQNDAPMMYPRFSAPLPTDTEKINILDEHLNHILEVIGSSWAISTKETYGAGLLVFHVYCNSLNIPEHQ